MTKTLEKPLVTVSGKKILFKSSLYQRIVQDLPQEGVEWRRRLDSNTKTVYLDVDFVDFDVDNVERSSERLYRLSIADASDRVEPRPVVEASELPETESTQNSEAPTDEDREHVGIEININKSGPSPIVDVNQTPRVVFKKDDSQDYDQHEQQRQNDISRAFFNQKLLGRPILHTYWADKTDFENESQKSELNEWIGQVQASTCTEWAIIIIEDGDFRAQIGTALLKSKLQSSTSQSNMSSSSISSLSQTPSFLDRMKKSLSTIFQGDLDSDRWLTLIDQEKSPRDHKAMESYANFVKKIRNVLMSSFSKQIELFEEQLRVQREMRTDKNWDFFAHFSMQEELAFAFEFLTLFDEALVQYDFLDALFTEYISSPSFNNGQEPLHDKWISFTSWPALCLDLNSGHSEQLRQRIVQKEASLLEFRNYLFAKRCDLMLMQNQPWRVAASANNFLHNCIREHTCLNIDVPEGALKAWSFVSSLEVLHKCECYSCSSTMENYSRHTVDLWNTARLSLIDLGTLLHRMPGMGFCEKDSVRIKNLLAGLGEDPHRGTSYQGNEVSPQARLKDALDGEEQFSKHLIEISELTLGTYKHIGRKRYALLVGKQLADFYIAQGNPTKALPFLNDFERQLIMEDWELLLEDIKLSRSRQKK